jgi:hypothetical protein
MRVEYHVQFGRLHLVDSRMSSQHRQANKYLSHDFSDVLRIKGEMTSSHEL